MPTTICASTTTATPRSSRDLKLQAELYKPNVGCIGIANPQEILHLNPMPGEMLTGEMSPYEGVLATQWLGLETVLPCHYITLDGDKDVAEYMKHHRAAKARGEQHRRPLSAASRRLDRVRRGRQGRASGQGGLSECAPRSSMRRSRSAWRRRRSPSRGPGEVLVAVKAAGLCAGDLYIYTGKNPYVSYPRIGCHEIAGVVEALRPGRQRPGRRHAGRRRPVHRLRPLLSLPGGQAQLLRQPARSSACIAKAVSPISSPRRSAI